MNPQIPKILRNMRRIVRKESHFSQRRHGFGHAVSCFIRSFPGQSPHCRRERGMTPIAKSAEGESPASATPAERPLADTDFKPAWRHTKLFKLFIRF